MKILIVAATWMEIKLLVDEFDFVGEKSQFLNEYRFAGNNIDVLITGIGTTFTTFHLTGTLFQNKYELVIDSGLAGCLTNDLNIGQVVNIISEEFADLGIEESGRFLTLFESGFMESNDFPFENGLLKAANLNGILDLSNVRAVTANTSHAKSESISVLREKFSAHVESMEGAAVFYVCKWFGIPVCEVRAISNYISISEASQWNIPLALENLKETIIDVLSKIAVPVN
jgi:futalosine hydrolase